MPVSSTDTDTPHEKKSWTWSIVLEKGIAWAQISNDFLSLS